MRGNHSAEKSSHFRLKLYSVPDQVTLLRKDVKIAAISTLISHSKDFQLQIHCCLGKRICLLLKFITKAYSMMSWRRLRTAAQVTLIFFNPCLNPTDNAILISSTVDWCRCGQKVATSHHRELPSCVLRTPTPTEKNRPAFLEVERKRTVVC